MELRVDEVLSSTTNTDHNAIVVEGLAQHAWAVVPNYLSPLLVEQLRSELLTAYEREELQRAGIGRDQAYHQNDLIRRDKTRWLDGSTFAQCRYLALMEELRLHINRELFLGLFDFESHYAVYEPGAFYRKHVDAFNGRSNRVVSVVSYLNPGWQQVNGGFLSIYDETGHNLIGSVAPDAGTVICFLSEKVPHEVTVAHQTRCSIAGWFRRNNSIGGMIDPPA